MYSSSPEHTRASRGAAELNFVANCRRNANRALDPGRNDAIDGGANFQGRVARSQPSSVPSRPARSEVAIVSNSRACPYRARVSLRVLAGHPPVVLRRPLSLSLSLPTKILVTRARCPHDPRYGPPLTDKGPFVTLATSFLIFLPLLPPPALLLPSPAASLRRCYRRRFDASWCTSRR